MYRPYPKPTQVN